MTYYLHVAALVFAACTLFSEYAAAACLRPQPSDVRVGVKYTGCDGKELVGTRAVRPACAEGDSNCVADSEMVAVSKTQLKNSVLAGESVAGISGTAVAPCTAPGQVDCRATAAWPAESGIDPYKIRAGVTVNGVTGKLKYCRNGANISARDYDGVASNTYTGASYPVTIDSLIDRISGITAAHIPLSGLRVRVSSTGTLPAELDSGTDYFTIFESNTEVRLASSLADALSGTAIDLSSDGTGLISLTVRGDGIVTDLDTIDDRNMVASGDGVSFGGNLTQSPFGSDYLCSHNDFVPLAPSPDGIKVVHGNVSNCDDASDQCMILDRMTGVIWTSLEPTGQTGLTHAEAQKSCIDLDYGGFDDWRLPDQNELAQAFVNAIGGIDQLYPEFKQTGSTIWSSTSRSNATIGWQGTKDAWFMSLYGGAADFDSKNSTGRKFRCVRDTY